MPEKKLCAVKNPLKRSNQSWFYNIFLGNIMNVKPDRNHVKVNWMMELTDNEIKLLRQKTCEIIEIDGGKIKKQVKKKTIDPIPVSPRSANYWLGGKK